MTLPWQELYQAVLVEHSKHPHNKRPVENADAAEHGYSPLCGDEIDVEVRLDAAGKIADIGFSGQGCAISQSSASLMTDAVKGMSQEEAAALAKKFIDMATSPPNSDPPEDLGSLRAMAGVRKFPMRVKCATLSWHALEGILKKLANPEEGA